MADFNEYSQKGATLMQQALKKYAEGNYEEGDKDRELANKYFDLASMEINSEAGKLSQLYGESRNFGIIYNVFEQNMDRLLKTKKGKAVIREGYRMIKENPILSEQFKIYDMFEKASGVDNSKDFVNEAVDIMKDCDRNKVKAENERFIKFMRKNKLDEYVEIPEETENLYEAIEYVMLNKRGYSNVNDVLKAKSVISEHIEKNAKSSVKKENDFESFNEKVEREEDTVNESLNDDEKKLLNEFMSKNADTRALFEQYKRDTLSQIQKTMDASDEEDKVSWKEVYESIESKKYSDKLSENIVNCAEMIEIVNTIKE